MSFNLISLWATRWTSRYEHSVPGRRARVRGSSCETPPCMTMAPGACKSVRGCNILQVPIQIITSGEWVSYLLRGESKL